MEDIAYQVETYKRACRNSLEEIAKFEEAGCDVSSNEAFARLIVAILPMSFVMDNMIKLLKEEVNKREEVKE